MQENPKKRELKRVMDQAFKEYMKAENGKEKAQKEHRDALLYEKYKDTGQWFFLYPKAPAIDIFKKCKLISKRANKLRHAYNKAYEAWLNEPQFSTDA